MATKTVLIDDIDGGEADVTIAFVINGDPYTLDLSQANAAKFWKAVNPYIAAAQKNADRHNTAIQNLSETFEQRQVIRDWARAQGYDISDRGRIPIDIAEAFNDAHK